MRSAATGLLGRFRASRFRTRRCQKPRESRGAACNARHESISEPQLRLKPCCAYSPGRAIIPVAPPSSFGCRFGQGRDVDEQATRLILELPAADASGVARARQAATSHAKQLGLDEDIQERVRLAVTEACANCVLHAYDGSGQAGGRAVGGSNPFAPMNERPAFAGLSRSCSQLEASLWFYGSHESHWFQLAGDSSAPRSLSATASVTAPHTRPKASTTTIGTFPRLRP